MTEFERFLSDSLKSVGESYEPTDVYGAKQTFLRRRRRRRWTLAATSLASATAVGLLALLVVQSTDADRPVRPAAPDALRLTTTVAVGERPSAVALGYGSAWVANDAGGSVSQIDLITDEILATIPTRGNPDEIVVGEGAVWVTNRSRASVQRIHPLTGDIVDEIPIGSQPELLTMDLTVGPGGIWVAALESGTVYRIDPERPGPPEAFPRSGTDVAADGTQVWAMDAQRGRLVRLAGTGAGPDVVRIPRRSATPNTDLAVGFGALWVALGDEGTVTRIDLGTGEHQATQVGGGYADLAVGADGVWALTGTDDDARGDLVRLDPLTGAALGGALAVDGSPIDVAAGSGYVWVAQSSLDRASRVGIGGRQAPSPEPQPTRSAPRNREPVLTMWPELTEEQRADAADRLRAGEDPWRRSAADTALQFARDVVEWVDPQLRAKENAIDKLGPRYVTVMLFKRPGSRSPTAQVVLNKCIERRWWCVTGVGDPDPRGRSFLSVSVQGRRVQLAFPHQRADRVVLQIGYGDVPTFTQEVGAPFSPMEFELSNAPSQPGFLMLRWFDARGRVFSAQGTALPAGDFSAG
ncbi:MAG: hypothetical protein ABR505_05990 [Actinomycetota bacterium]